ncbi:hypothetical protein BBO99_00002428 [Phytophthora kernoviae]|uniref:Uncharacterized protein n=2 Tax=Phytophthora kernoviae TaxID=325452 RepID=A0A3R7K1Z2_9STRA|nr:hypothetical protein G195_007912 [Phytophthora kernoviae 00238/432]KAG2527109.1 hypothetical protein JM16_001899 [Phytophthora kernoviae]KAG2528560.1 hypothetical protein JM18_002001 [Phytophthora kernoviae]RLN31863.1 hypothetical protein BBI17_000498 [Phytophthora kernoviae]RLN83060.1 hypothetical protein BBO99_00002428 [Phytophthora kernoviae]
MAVRGQGGRRAPPKRSDEDYEDEQLLLDLETELKQVQELKSLTQQHLHQLLQDQKQLEQQQRRQQREHDRQKTELQREQQEKEAQARAQEAKRRRENAIETKPMDDDLDAFLAEDGAYY